MVLEKRTILNDIFGPLLFSNSLFEDVTDGIQTVGSEAPDDTSDPPGETTAAHSATADNT